MRAPAAALLLTVVLAAACRNDSGSHGTRAYVYTTEQQVRMPLPDSIVAEDAVLPRALLLRGDSVYHGLVNRGTCSMCHGNHGRGGPIGRDFTDNEWSHIDGTYQGIVRAVVGGIEYDPPMPPFGGAPLTDLDVRAVAAYVYFLSRRDGNPLRH